MKFRTPKTGEVFEDIGEAHSRFCGSADSGKRCDECPLGVSRTGYGCISFRNAHPTETARLMGYEVVEESFAERLDASVRKEGPMEDTGKPHINWDRIGPKTAVWCATEEEAAEFVWAAHEHGYHWAGSVPDGRLCRGAGCDTVYYIRDGHLTWSSRSAATSYVDAVVDFSDLLEAASDEAQDGRPRVLGVEDFERICEAVHNGWRDEKKRQGVTDHPDMIPYDELAEDVKEYDRVTVRRVLDALGIRYESKPRFSDEEVAVLRHFISTGVKRIKRGQNGGTMIWDAVGVGSSMSIPDGFLPSLRPGQSIALGEIIGG